MKFILNNRNWVFLKRVAISVQRIGFRFIFFFRFYVGINGVVIKIFINLNLNREGSEAVLGSWRSMRRRKSYEVDVRETRWWVSFFFVGGWWINSVGKEIFLLIVEEGEFKDGEEVEDVVFGGEEFIFESMRFKS